MSALKQLAESNRFQGFIIAVIVFAGVLVGLETYPGVVAEVGPTLHVLDKIILGIFVVEAVVRMGAEWPRPWRYFTDGWNVFDFSILAVCFLPLDASYFAVLR